MATQFFRASSAQNLCDPDAGRLIFSDLNAMLPRPTLGDVVKHAQRTLAECALFFLRGACRISKNFAIFCRIFAQNSRHLDAELSRYCALQRRPTRKRAETKSCASRNHAGRVHATFLRAARRKFSGNLQFFRASWAQNARNTDAGRFQTSSDLNAILNESTLSDIVQYAQRTMAECTQFLCAGRAQFPKILQIFDYLKISPDFCADFA